MSTLFSSCSVVMYAGVYTGNSSTQGTLYSIIPNSGQGDFSYTGSVGITGSSRINSALNFTEFTTNATPRIDYSYTSESFAFSSGSTLANPNMKRVNFFGSVESGTSIGSLILEGETNNHYLTPLETVAASGVNFVTSSLSKFPSLGNYNHNVITFQEDNTNANHRFELDFDNGTFSGEKIGKFSFCVSGGIPFTDTTLDKARMLYIEPRGTDGLYPINSTRVSLVINPPEFQDAKTEPDSASVFFRSPYITEFQDIGDGWLKCTLIGRTQNLLVADGFRFNSSPMTGDTAEGSDFIITTATDGSGSAPFTNNDPANFTSNLAKFSIANLQMELISSGITASLSGSDNLQNALAFVPGTSFIPTSESVVTKPAESLEVPLTSSTVSSILTNHNQGTIITRFAWTPVSGSDEASSNHFALLKTGSASTTDFLRIDGRGIFHRNEAGTLVSLTSASSQVPYLRQSGSLFPSTFHNYAFTWSGSAMSCSIDSGSIITTSTNIWTGSAAEQLEYIGGVMGISDHTQVRLQYIMVSPHKFDADALKNATTGSIV